MTTTETPDKWTGSTTLDDVKDTMREFYGVHVCCIGEDGNMVALGHHEPKRVIAALNRYSREEIGLLNICDSSWVSYTECAEFLEWKHAVIVNECDDHDPQDDSLFDGCHRCLGLASDEWHMRWSGEPSEASFPVTMWRP